MDFTTIDKLQEILELLKKGELIEVDNFGSLQAKFKAQSNIYKYLDDSPAYRVEQHKTYKGELVWVKIDDLQTGKFFATDVKLA